MSQQSGDASATVRAAVPSDRDEVWLLVRDFATSFTSRRPAFDVAFDACLTAPDTVVAVAVLPGRGTVGYVVAHPQPTFFANGPVAWVQEVMVASHLRGVGTGRALMTHVEQWARGRGAAYVSLATRRAGAFYERLGYEDSAVFYRPPLRSDEDAPPPG